MSGTESSTVVITGAASGIGSGLARAAASLGMNLVLGDRDEGGLSRIEGELADSGRDVLAMVIDVTDPAAVDRLANAAWDRFGSVEVLINNAGIEIGGKSWELSHADWKRALDVNIMGPVNGIKTFVPRMIAAAKPAHVAIVTSLGALGSIGGQAPYMASKHGAQALCESLFLELQRDAPFIRVSSILPAGVATKIWSTALGDESDKARQAMIKVVAEQGMDADQAGRMIFERILKGDYWITTDDAFMRDTAKLRADFLTSQTDPFWQFDPYAFAIEMSAESPSDGT